MSNQATRYARAISEKRTLSTPQSEAIPGREAEMVTNSAGAASFTISKWDYLDRFIILGSESNSYYASAQKLTIDAAKKVIALIGEDGVRVVNRVVEISDSGRAPKNDSAIFVLALAAIKGNDATRAAAWSQLDKVCRIGTHLFSFVSVIDELGKWNASAKRGVSNWYNQKDLDTLAFQLVKYQQRNGWSHRDVLRLAHVKPKDVDHSMLFNWVVKREDEMTRAQSGARMPTIVSAYEAAKADPKTSLAGIEAGLTWEMLPTEVLKDPAIWMALLPKMGLTAMIRNLGKMSAIGVGSPLSEGQKLIVSKLSDSEMLRKARVHPITILQAIKTYGKGRGDKGSLTWPVNQRIVDALNDSFYASFGVLPKTDQSYLIGIDCSGSMFGASVNGMPNLTAAEASAVMAMATMKTTDNYWVGGFDTSISELKITPSMRLDQVLPIMQRFNWGGTDCSTPMLHAMKHKMNVDKFVVYTDNETWAGQIHPSQALKQYREKFGRGKLVVCGTSQTNFTIADPKDGGMLDVVGFDSSAPQIIAQF